MPLNQLNNSAILKNKQNKREIDPESENLSSPVKPLANNFHQTKFSPLKKPTSSLNAQINQLKIKLSDREFELKKLEEDCSVKLALMQKELNKQKTEKKLAIKDWKERLEEDKHYYETRLVIVDQEWKAKVQQVKNDVRKEGQQINQKEKKSLCDKFESLIQQLNLTIQQNLQKSKKEKSTLQQTQKSQIQQIHLKHRRQLQQYQAKFQQQINQLKQTHQSEIKFYQQVDNQKTKEQNVVAKILSEKVRGLQEEIRILRGEIGELKQQIQKKDVDITRQRREKEDFKLDKICLERKLARIEPELKEQCEKQIRLAKSQFETLLTQRVSQFSANLAQIQSLNESSTLAYQQQLELLQERCNQISSLYSTMKSNEEDLKKISTLQMKLIKKQMELQKQREDTKMCKLELSNMDQIFQKMFEEAKVKSLKSRKHRLPSLLVPGTLNRSTMDCYGAGGSNVNGNVLIGGNSGQSLNNIKDKELKKFSIRDVNYHSISKAKQNNNEFSAVYE